MVEQMFDRNGLRASREDARVLRLERQNARAQLEIVALSQMVMSATAAPKDVGGKVTSGGVQDDATRRAMFEVMAMSLHLTRVPVVMRFGFFRRRHQRRLARALRDHRLIDPVWYRATYPEVAESGLDSVLYFVIHGIKAGHAPHPKFLSEEPS